MRFLLSAVLLCTAGAQAAGVPGQGTWETTLQARDINHDGVVDAYYDTELKVTWLADADYPLTSGYDTHSPPFALGAMTWNDANIWAQSLSLFGVTGWRLPRAFMPAGCVETAFSCSDSPSELSHLFEHTLGGADNSGPFINIGSDSLYWAGPMFSYNDLPMPSRAFGYNFINGSRGETDELGLALYAWGVHDGDIAAVPEPHTLAMMLAGLGVVGMLARRRTKG